MLIDDEYLNHSPLRVNHIYEHSKIPTYKIPKFKLNDNHRLLEPNYPMYINNYNNNHLCVITPEESTVKCYNAELLPLYNHFS